MCFNMTERDFELPDYKIGIYHARLSATFALRAALDLTNLEERSIFSVQGTKNLWKYHVAFMLYPT